MLQNVDRIVPGYSLFNEHDRMLSDYVVNCIDNYYRSSSTHPTRKIDNREEIPVESAKMVIDYALKIVFNMNYEEVFRKCRMQHLVTARSIVYLSCMRKFGNPTCFWQKVFNVDHATFRHSLKTAEDHLSVEVQFMRNFSYFYHTMESFLESGGLCEVGIRGFVI